MGKGQIFLIAIVAMVFTVSRAISASADAQPRRRALIIGLDGTTGAQFQERALKQKLAPMFADLMATGKYAPCEKARDEHCARAAHDESNANRDDLLTQFMLKNINDPSMDVIMGVFDKIDATGHQSGFSSNDRYLAAISTADGQVKQLIDAVKAGVQNRHEEWLVIVTADHGGHNILGFVGTHDIRNYDDDAIPFVINTFGASESLRDLTYPVSHLDVHPTVLAWFGLAATPDVDGHVQSILSQ